MEIISRKNYQELLDYLPSIKSSFKQWQLVDIRLSQESHGELTPAAVAELVHGLFKDKKGKIYLCNDREIFMLIHWGEGGNPQLIVKPIEERLPPGSCHITSMAPTAEGLQKLELVVNPVKSALRSPYAERRTARRENIVLVADDDMYMRLLVKKGISGQATVHEVADGNEVISAYQQHVPDIVFLDIHLPSKEGPQLLQELLAIDPQAHIIMLSADSSSENVSHTMREGAKGFMAKPFTKEKLLEYLKKCPTFS